MDCTQNRQVFYLVDSVSNEKTTMGELNLIDHVNMKIKSITDVIDHLKSQYNWIKSQECIVSLSLPERKEINDFQIKQLDLILFLFDEEKKLFDLKRAHLRAAMAHLQRTTGIQFYYIYCFKSLIVDTIVCSWV